MIKLNKLFRNPFKYYKIYKRKEKIRLIRVDRIWKESILGMWATKTIVQMPLYNLTNTTSESVIYDKDKWTYKIPYNENNNKQEV